MFSCFAFAVAGTKCFLADFCLRPSALAVHLVHISGQMFQDSAQTFTDLAFGFLLNVGLSSAFSKLCLSHLSLHLFPRFGWVWSLHSFSDSSQRSKRSENWGRTFSWYSNPNKLLQTQWSWRAGRNEIEARTCRGFVYPSKVNRKRRCTYGAPRVFLGSCHMPILCGSYADPMPSFLSKKLWSLQQGQN